MKFRKLLNELIVYMKAVKPEDVALWEENSEQLTQKIAYSFKHKNYLCGALTHNSFLRANEDELAYTISPFERMEYLGDSILGFIVAEELFKHYPAEREGYLSKLKAKIVSEKYLANKALQLNLGEYILMSADEKRAGGMLRKSILSDAMEALICAIYLDGGMRKTRNFIRNLILDDFEEAIKNEELTNYKSKLQEYSQSLYQIPPEYIKVLEDGPDHQKLFGMEVWVKNNLAGYGQGSNKKEAQQNAAKDACKKLGI